MPITLTFHIGIYTISVRIYVKSKNRHSAK